MPKRTDNPAVMGFKPASRAQARQIRRRAKEAGFASPSGSGNVSAYLRWLVETDMAQARVTRQGEPIGPL